MDKAKLIAVTCLMAMLLGACSANTSGNLCSAGPIIADPGADQRWTRSEKEQVVGLNNAGADICRWRPIAP